jgi:hypothetical protein
MAEALFVTEFSVITNPVRLYWYLQTNPSAVVGEYDLPYPNIDGEETVITGLSSKLYRFEFWEMSAGVQTSLVGKPIYLKPKGEKTAVELYHYTVGRGLEETDPAKPYWSDPSADQKTLIDERLDGKTFHVSQRVNDWRQPTDYAAITGGGFELAITDEYFVDGDQWTVMVISNVETEVPVFAAMPVHLVSVSEDFDDTYHNRHNISTVASAGVTQVTTFPSFALIPDNTAKFSTHSTAARYWKLQFDTGDSVRWLGEDANSIVLRQGDELELIFDGGIAYASYKGCAELAGEYLFANKKLINTEYADGSEAGIADYEDLIDRLPAALVVSYADYNLTENKTVGNVLKTYYKNRGKFAVDTTAGTFKFPDLRDYSFHALKNVDGTTDSSMLSQGPGGIFPQELIKHNHSIESTAGSTSSNGTADVLRGTVQGEPNTQGSTGANKTIGETGGTRQMIDSVAQIPLVRI